jgi:hypothetical protein
MKIRFFAAGVILSFFILNACNDELGTVGVTIQPEGDKSTVYTDTFELKASTRLLDSVYAKSSYGLLGEIYDPLFGNLKSDYICQFRTEEKFRFAQTPIDGQIDSIDLSIGYDHGGWIGDSLAPMHVKVYPIIKQLEQNFYTHTDPREYADMQNPIGEQTYTPRNLNISDSIWNLPTTDYNYYYPRVKVRMPKELGQKFYDETVNHPSSFDTQQAFNQFFPGLYVTNTFGSGNILVVNQTVLTIHYRYLTANDAGVVDSVVYTSEIFIVTPEVVQLNNFKNTDISHLLEPNDEYSYLKTPAGVFTRLTIPTREILSRINGRRVNSFNVSLKAMPQEEWAYALNPPAYLLLLPEDSLTDFFREDKMYNSVTSFISSQYAALTYDFGNMAPLLRHVMANDPEREEMHFLLIPVEPVIETSNSTQYITGINNYLKPSGVRLRKTPDVMRFQVLTSTYSTD